MGKLRSPKGNVWVHRLSYIPNTFNRDSPLVPHMPRKSCYGWGIKVSTADTLIKFREEFTLPAEPKFWSGENNEFATNRIINKRRISITNEFSKPDKGWVKKV